MGEITAPHEKLIAKILCGGETGADRAAVDFAIEHGVTYGGWVPLDGWAEDLRAAPGLLGRYSNFVPTKSADVEVRTSLNVRDANATVVFAPMSAVSRGVSQTLDIANVLKRPVAVLYPHSPEAPRAWRSSCRCEGPAPSSMWRGHAKVSLRASTRRSVHC